MNRIPTYILIFCILIINFSCRNTSLISRDEIGQKSTDEEVLILKTAHNTYELRNYKLESEYIVGDIYNTRTIKGESDFILVILNPNYSIISEEFPIKGAKIHNSLIDKIKYKQYDATKSLLTVTAIIVPVLVILGLLISDAFATIGGLS